MLTEALRGVTGQPWGRQTTVWAGLSAQHLCSSLWGTVLAERQKLQSHFIPIFTVRSLPIAHKWNSDSLQESTGPHWRYQWEQDCPGALGKTSGTINHEITGGSLVAFKGGTTWNAWDVQHNWEMSQVPHDYPNPTGRSFRWKILHHLQVSTKHFLCDCHKHQIPRNFVWCRTLLRSHPFRTVTSLKVTLTVIVSPI